MTVIKSGRLALQDELNKNASVQREINKAKSNTITFPMNRKEA